MALSQPDRLCEFLDGGELTGIHAPPPAPRPPDGAQDVWQEGARRALADAGLDGEEAAMDVRDQRALLDCIRFVRRTAVQTTVHFVTTGIILALLAGIALKLKIFDPGG